MVALRRLAAALVSLSVAISPLAQSFPPRQGARVAPGPASASSGVPVPAKKAQPPAAPQRGSEAPVVYSVGDLHGDFERFKLILDGLGLASFQALYSPRGEPLGDVATWTGGRTILVFTGDTVDRGDHSRPIFSTFMSLRRQAAAAGGEIVNILGNHDLMNIQGDFEYVSNAELHSKGDYGGPQARRREFSGLGAIGADIRKNFLVAAVRGSTLFVHAGLDPMWLRQSGGSIDAMNRRVRAMINKPTIPNDEPILKGDGPLWDRKFADRDPRACDLVEETLRLVGASRMAVGHTIQPNGVEVMCPSPSGPRIVLADTAISRAYGAFGKASAVEYKANAVTAIYFQAPKGTAPRRVSLASSPERLALPMPGRPVPRPSQTSTPRPAKQEQHEAALVPKQPQPQVRLPTQPGSAGTQREPWLWQKVSQIFTPEPSQVITRSRQAISRDGDRHRAAAAIVPVPAPEAPQVITTLTLPQPSKKQVTKTQPVQKRPQPLQLQKQQPQQLHKEPTQTHQQARQPKKQQTMQQKQNQHRQWLSDVVRGPSTSPPGVPTFEPPPSLQDSSFPKSVHHFAPPHDAALAGAFAFAPPPASGPYGW